jgi:hypothetical protein
MARTQTHIWADMFCRYYEERDQDICRSRRKRVAVCSPRTQLARAASRHVWEKLKSKLEHTSAPLIKGLNSLHRLQRMYAH